MPILPMEVCVSSTQVHFEFRTSRRGRACIPPCIKIESGWVHVVAASHAEIKSPQAVFFTVKVFISTHEDTGPAHTPMIFTPHVGESGSNSRDGSLRALVPCQRRLAQ